MSLHEYLDSSNPPANLPVHNPPAVLFRAEDFKKVLALVTQQRKKASEPRLEDRRFQDALDLIPKEAFDACLMGKSLTPFTKFTSSWVRAVERRKLMLKRGHSNVVIFAIQANHRKDVYNAHEAAKCLGYKNGGSDIWRQLKHHEEEFLITEPYEVLAIFEGHGEVKDEERLLNMLVQGEKTPLGLQPDGFVEPVSGCPDALKEVFSTTAVQGQGKHILALTSTVENSYQWRYYGTEAQPDIIDNSNVLLDLSEEHRTRKREAFVVLKEVQMSEDSETILGVSRLAEPAKF